MSNRRFSRNTQPLDKAIDQLTTQLNNQGVVGFVGATGQASNIMSMESIDGAQLKSAQSTIATAKENIRGILADAGT